MASSIHQNIEKRSKNLSRHFSHGDYRIIVSSNVFPVFYTIRKHREQYLLLSLFMQLRS